ncbi:spondin domain-containing protein [Pacificimonas sp. WHA3]|uniref:Spondin domain-containing protein n=1 Tax=Pacificimonas pallii TaxID=2827236 RepID=A0ABS6SCL2_9SPHN|nr:spondin domain-containing protein [Pacificimonas pallii]MBV7256153.1 spondin domain-containing protein [Pacificimonas pallii]
MRFKTLATGAIAIAVTAAPMAVAAKTVALTVTIENIAPENTVSFAPLRFGFGNGTFDAFNINEAAGAEIISIAEGGSGSAWLPAFAAADPGAVIGSSAGAQIPGTSQIVGTFNIDTEANRFFTFANMVVPSNDLFLGNDNPMAFNLFDDDGNLQLFDITQTVAAIWDANSEVADPDNAAFIPGANNDARIAENGLIAFAFDELSVFNGLTTAAGYVFDGSNLRLDTDIFRVTFSAVDVNEVAEPAAILPFASGLALLGFAAVRRRRRA